MDINWVLIETFLAIGIVVIGPTVLVIWILRRRARATQNPEIEAEYVRAGLEVASSWVHGGAQALAISATRAPLTPL